MYLWSGEMVLRVQCKVRGFKIMRVLSQEDDTKEKQNKSEWEKIWFIDSPRKVPLKKREYYLAL